MKGGHWIGPPGWSDDNKPTPMMQRNCTLKIRNFPGFQAYEVEKTTMKKGNFYSILFILASAFVAGIGTPFAYFVTFTVNYYVLLKNIR
jgi:hypothetical protein